MKYTLLMSLLLLLTSCGKKPENEYVDFFFQLPFQMTARDTVAVGDTLWLTADFSDQLLNASNGQAYPVTPQNFELRTKLGLFELTKPTKDLSNQPAATEYFAFANKLGGLASRGTTFSPLTYVYANGRYRLRVGLIPQRRGVFCASFLDGWASRGSGQPGPDLSYLVSGRTPDGGKRIASFWTFYFYINGGRTNFYLFKEHCLALSANSTQAGLVNGEQEGTFTFVVK